GLPTQGSSRVRRRSRTAPIGPASTWTRSRSSEYRLGGASTTLWSAVPPPERECLLECRIRENLHERPGEDEILLDHPVVGPGYHPPPGGDVGRRDHAFASRSTSSLTATRQRASRSVPVIGAPGESGVTRGARASTHSARTRATSWRPARSSR